MKEISLILRILRAEFPEDRFEESTLFKVCQSKRGLSERVIHKQYSTSYSQSIFGFWTISMMKNMKSESNLNTRVITPKRAASGGAHLRSLTHGLHSSEEKLRRWRAVGVTVSDLTHRGIEP